MGKGTGGKRKRDRAYGFGGTVRNSVQVVGWSMCSGEEQEEGRGAGLETQVGARSRGSCNASLWSVAFTLGAVGHPRAWQV